MEGEDEFEKKKKTINASEKTERWMRKMREERRITMGRVALLGLFGTSLSPVASGY